MSNPVQYCLSNKYLPVVKHLESEKAVGEKRGLEADESLKALAVEEALILIAILERCV